MLQKIENIITFAAEFVLDKEIINVFMYFLYLKFFSMVAHKEKIIQLSARLLIGMFGIMALFFYSCKKKEIPKVEPTLTSYKIIFDSKNGAAINAVTVKLGDILTLPANPTKIGFAFGGWYTDSLASTSPFSISTAINANFTLYAKWDAFTLSSSSFIDKGEIPPKYAKRKYISFHSNRDEYLNVSPQLSWKNAPEGTTSFFIIMQKKDNYSMFKYSNWYVYNIPASQTSIAENEPSIRGNCSPYEGPWVFIRETNTYQFIIYALDLPENYFCNSIGKSINPPTTKEEIETGILSRHILAKASITGTFTEK